MKIKNDKITLDKFIEESLYNKKFGYYMKKDPFGKRVILLLHQIYQDLFSEMIAIWVISFGKSLGCPKKFNLIELGAGNGEMMKVLIETFKNFQNFLMLVNLIS